MIFSNICLCSTFYNTVQSIYAFPLTTITGIVRRRPTMKYFMETVRITKLPKT